MIKRTYGFDNIKIASPCNESWDSMTGDEKVRFCGACERHVYNFSTLTGHQIAELIRENEGQRKCVRFFRRQDGTILTKDCPVGHTRARRKAVGVFASAVAALFGGLAFVGNNSSSVDGNVMGMMLPPDDAGFLMGEAEMGDLVTPEDVPQTER